MKLNSPGVDARGRRSPATAGRRRPPCTGQGAVLPGLVYRTGAYAPNGVPFANGYVDYLKLVNAKGGINGVKIS